MLSASAGDLGVGDRLRRAGHPVGSACTAAQGGVLAAGAMDGRMLVAILVATMFVTIGCTRLVGVSSKIRLAAGGRGGAERVVDRVGHGAGRQHEFVWIWPSDDTEPGAAGEPRSAVRPGVLDVVVDTAFPREHAYRKMAS